MRFGVSLGGFGGMVRRVMMMAVGDVCVMRCEVMTFFFVVPRGLAMMTRRVFVMLGSLLVMLDGVLGHVSSSMILSRAGGQAELVLLRGDEEKVKEELKKMGKRDFSSRDGRQR
jgi:hypothetical protein